MTAFVNLLSWVSHFPLRGEDSPSLLPGGPILAANIQSFTQGRNWGISVLEYGFSLNPPLKSSSFP